MIRKNITLVGCYKILYFESVKGMYQVYFFVDHILKRNYYSRLGLSTTITIYLIYSTQVAQSKGLSTAIHAHRDMILPVQAISL